MKRTHTHSHIPLLIFAMTVTLVVIALYGYMFQTTSVSVTRAGLARDIVLSENNDQTQSKSLSVLLDSTTVDRARLNSFFVSSDNVVAFITSLEALGTQSGSTLTISSINTDVPSSAPAGTTGHVSTHLDAHGSWASVMNLLNLSEHMSYDASVSHVTLSSNSVDPKSPHTWSISFDIQALLMVPSVSASSTTQ